VFLWEFSGAVCTALFLPLETSPRRSAPALNRAIRRDFSRFYHCEAKDSGSPAGLPTERQRHFSGRQGRRDRREGGLFVHPHWGLRSTVRTNARPRVRSHRRPELSLLPLSQSPRRKVMQQKPSRICRSSRTTAPVGAEAFDKDGEHWLVRRQIRAASLRRTVSHR
jgi:hypothetical protein